MFSAGGRKDELCVYNGEPETLDSWAAYVRLWGDSTKVEKERHRCWSASLHEHSLYRLLAAYESWHVA